MSAADVANVIPTVHNWELGRGVLPLSDVLRVVGVPDNQGDCSIVAGVVGGVLGRRLPVILGEGSVKGAIRLVVDEAEQGYTMRIDEGVQITAASREGFAHAAQTLAQLGRTGLPLPRGVMHDVAHYAERGVLIDTVPRSFRRAWWQTMVNKLSMVKLNTLTVIQNGVGLAAREWHWLDEQCADVGITLIPIIPVASHADSLLTDSPSYVVDADTSDPLIAKAFDFTKAGALDLVRRIVNETASQIRGPYWHMGGDEYLAFPAHARPWEAYPQFAAFARHVTGNESAKGSDAYVWFVNHVASLVAEHGKTLRVWNDFLHRGVVALDPSIVVEHWYQPTDPTALLPAELVRTNAVLNCHEEHLYYDMGWRHPSTADILTAFDPTRFQGSRAPVSGNLLGARFHIWLPDSDRAECRHESSIEVAQRVSGPLAALSELLWNPATDRNYLVEKLTEERLANLWSAS